MILKISIPTGTIKSGEKWRNEVFATQFQFLLVRLKALLLQLAQFRRFDFNSYWYD